CIGCYSSCQAVEVLYSGIEEQYIFYSRGAHRLACSQKFSVGMPNSPVATEFLGQETLLCSYFFYCFFLMISCGCSGFWARNPCGGVTYFGGDKNWFVADALHGQIGSRIVDDVPISR
ncbi:hypothetical protein, partial [Microcoleus sp. AT9_A5]|uniref:hypothetical protein n=1 Tax=Microcoleus sp. AT9_A5 TaxID=2818625 RepID=UPI002FD0521D